MGSRGRRGLQSETRHVAAERRGNRHPQAESGSQRGAVMKPNAIIIGTRQQASRSSWGNGARSSRRPRQCAAAGSAPDSQRVLSDAAGSGSGALVG